MWKQKRGKVKKAKVENVGTEYSKIKRPFSLLPHFPLLHFFILAFY